MFGLEAEFRFLKRGGRQQWWRHWKGEQRDLHQLWDEWKHIPHCAWKIHKGGFHWVGVSREWQIVFTDHCSYFWLLKIQALTEPSLRLYLMIILTTKSPCVCEFENILDICLFRFSYSQIIEETRFNNHLLTACDFSTLVNLKIGKNLLQTNSDEIRFHSFFAIIFSALTAKSSAKRAFYLFILTFSTWTYIFISRVSDSP